MAQKQFREPSLKFRFIGNSTGCWLGLSQIRGFIIGISPYILRELVKQSVADPDGSNASIRDGKTDGSVGG